MTEQDLKQEVKKAVDLFQDKTYELSDLESHVLSIIKENSDQGEKHKTQLERFMYLYEQLRINQRMYFAGHRNKLGTCKTQEAELDKKISYLISFGGYSIERYREKAGDNSLFK